MAVSMSNYLVSLLAEYFPELDATEGSDLYAQVVQPVIDRLGEDIFETDIESFVSQRVRDEYPELDIDTAGSAAKDIFINPVILLFQAIKRELNTIRDTQSLAQTSTLGAEELDALLANVFVVRRPGTHAAGDVYVYYSSPTTILADPTITFQSSGGQLYVVDGSVDVTEADMALQVEGDLYYAILPVISVLEDVEANIDVGQISTASGLPGYVKVTNKEAFTGGVTLESNAELLARAGDLITERSLVTERGVRTVVLQEYPELRGVSVIGTGDDEMVRDIIRGNTNISGLGYGPLYAAGQYGYFELSVAWQVWPTQRFPINNVLKGLVPSAAPTDANMIFSDWYSDQPAIGDQVSVFGHYHDVTAVSSPFADGEVELDILMLASSLASGTGGTLHSVAGGQFAPVGQDAGGFQQCAPMFFTQRFGQAGAIPSDVIEGIDPETDWLVVRDETFVVGPGGAAGGTLYNRSKYYPIESINPTTSTLTVRSQNLKHSIADVHFTAWGGPDVAQATFWALAPGNGEGVGLFKDGGTGYLELRPNDDLDFSTEDVLPGDFVTLFKVEEVQSTQNAQLWIECIVDSLDLSTGYLILKQHGDWLNDGAVGGMMPVLFGAGTPFTGWTGGAPIGGLNTYSWYWTVRRSNNESNTTPDLTYGWPCSYLPAWELPPNYSWAAAWTGAVPTRQHGERYPEERENVDPTVVVATNDPAYTPFTGAEWAIIRIPTAKLPAVASDWTEGTPLGAGAFPDPPHGPVLTTSPVVDGTHIGYPVRLYGSYYTSGLVDCGDPVDTTGGGNPVYRTDDWTTEIVATSWTIGPGLAQWGMRKPATADSLELGITLSQLPEVVGPVEIPPDELHIGGMMDVYCNPSSMEESSIAMTPWLSFEDSDVVVPATYIGDSATGGVTGLFGTDDGKFDAAALATYTWERGDVLLITGPAVANDHYLSSYAIVDQDRYLKNLIRVYPPFTGASVSGMEFVVLRGVTTDLTPVKLYKVRGGVDLKTNISSNLVSSGLKNFVTSGVAEGDTLAILEGKDLGTYTIDDVAATYLKLSSTLGGGETNLDFTVYTASGSASLPATEVTKISGLDSAGVAVTADIPYGLPLGALVRAAAMPGNRLALSSSPTTLGTITNVVTSDNLFTVPNAVDLLAFDVSAGMMVYIKNGAHAGESYPIAELGTPDGFGEIHYVVLGGGFRATAVETATVEYEIGYATQGTARCYFKAPVQVEFNQDTRVEVGTGKTFIPDPDTATQVYQEASKDTDLILISKVPAPFASDGVTDAVDLFTVTTPIFTAAHVNQYLFLQNGGLPGTHDAKYFQIFQVNSPTQVQLTMGAPGPFLAVYTGVDWTLQATNTAWSVLKSALPANDFATLDIKENSDIAMGTRGDSDVVYINHEGIRSTGVLVDPVAGLAGQVLTLSIGGTSGSYTFTTNSIPRADIPSYIETAFPSVEATIDATNFLWLFSTQDLVVGSGTANNLLQLTAGADNIPPVSLQGPHQIGYNGVAIDDVYPPIDAINLAYLRLIQMDSNDEPLDLLSDPPGRNLHVTIERRGTQIIKSTEMASYNGYYYADLDIASYYPGPAQLVSEQTESTSITGVVTNGFEYVVDPYETYSPLEPLSVKVGGVFRTTAFPIPVLGSNAQVNYTYAQEAADVHYFLQSKDERTVTCNALGKVSTPLEIAVQLTYKSSTSVEGAEAIVKEYLRSVPHGTLFTVRGFTSALRASGILVQSTPTVLIVAPDADRTYQLTAVEEEYQMPDSAAFLTVYMLLTKV